MKKFVLLVLCALMSLVSLVYPRFVSATALSNYTWVQHQPSSSTGNIVGVAVDQSTPTTIYILTSSAGVFKSTNSGTSWTAKNTGLPADLTVHSTGYGNLLTMDPNDSSVLYINIGGVPYKSTDGATNWTSIGSGISVCSPTQVTGIVVDTTNSNHIFASHIAAGCSGGTFESTNQGSTWTQISGEGVGSGTGNDSWTLAIDPTNNQKMYIGTIHGVVAYSTDGGHSWTQNLPSGASQTSNVVAVHPSTTSRIFLGNESGLYYSTDSAVNWTSLLSQVPYSVTDIKFAPSDSSIGYLASSNGIYKTTDGGLNWTQMGQASLAPKGISIDSTDPTIIYIATPSLGVYRSTNSGTSASAINSGLPTSSNMQTITQSKSNNDILMVGATSNALTVGFKSTDRGFTWSLLGIPTGTSFTAYGFNIHPTDPNIVYARISNGSAFKFIKSIDGGSTWSDTGLTITSGFGWSSLDPTTPSTILVSDLDGYMHRSDDSGSTWTTEASFNPTHSLPDSISNDVQFAPSNSQIAYGASYKSVWKSTDNGVTWTQQTNGIPQTGGSNWINYVTIDPTDANIVYAVSRDNNIYKTTDGGSNWSSVSSFGASPGKIIIDADTASTLYVFISGAWYKSIDSGANWTAQSTSGTFETGTIRGLIQDLADHNRFLMSGSSKGVVAYENSIPVYSTSSLSVSRDNSSHLGSSDTQTYTVTATNTGYGTSTNTNVVVNLNSGYSYRSGTAKIDGFAMVGNPLSSSTLTIPVGSLSRNQSSSVTFQVGFSSYSCHGNYTQTASVSSTEDSSGTSVGSVDSQTDDCSGTISGPQSCTDSISPTVPDLYQVKAYKNKVILQFAPPSDPYSNFYVAYGFSENDIRFGTQFNQGHSTGSIAHEIGHLAPNTTYYFKIRSGNGCSVGGWSNSLKIRTTSGSAYKYYYRWTPPKTSKTR